MSSNEQTGALIVQKQKHLQEFSDADLRYYSATISAGQCGRLLGKMRRLEVIRDLTKIQVFGADVGIYDRLMLESRLNELEKQGCIDVYREKGKITKIEERMKTESEIFKTTGEIYEELDPSEEEQASLEVVRCCTTLPRSESELMGLLESAGYKENVSRISTDLTTKFKITNKIMNVPGIDEPVLHTPLHPTYNIPKIVNQLRTLDYNTHQQLEVLLKKVGTNQAAPKSRIRLPLDQIDMLHKLGIIDISKVETVQGREEEFVFTPSMWGPFGTPLLPDEQEHIRAMLSCVQFGQLYPTEVDGKRFPIKYPSKYLNALITRGKVGPSTPIGSDYVIMEREGIVELKPCSYRPGQYEMYLVKEDVAQHAKRVLDRKADVELDSESSMESLCQTGDLVNTAQTRIQAEAKVKMRTGRSDILRKEIIKVLRREK